LERALRGILDAGGDIRSEWNLENVLRAGDRAVGVSVLQRLYAKMKDKPVSVDLAALWAQLGVQSDGTNVRFDDNGSGCDPPGDDIVGIQRGRGALVPSRSRHAGAPFVMGPAK
jgi:hypothetical protein